MTKIGPNRRTEQIRKSVLDSLRNILETQYENYGKIKICKYGSDPLKTYLPNSDIDITLVPILQHSDASDTNSPLVPAIPNINFYHELDSITKKLVSMME